MNAAHAVGAAERAGTIAVGRRADFVLFDLPSADRIAYRIGSFRSPFIVGETAFLGVK